MFTYCFEIEERIHHRSDEGWDFKLGLHELLNWFAYQNWVLGPVLFPEVADTSAHWDIIMRDLILFFLSGAI